ncbi:MAG: NAD(P)/FAD-dependent oxidoreductase [Vulcanisaeta sp.]|uniref:NAD(P)/FAD-dependent oxidoreductase n=1 Tax=Vulcanisaeta sp. TaxID=2020871 RepID=UPI003D0D79B4
MDAVIIGGGVLGTVLAYLLTARGVNATLINSGFQRPRFPLIHSKLLRISEDIRLARISEDVYRELSREIGIDVLRPMDSVTIIPNTCYDDTSRLMNMWHNVGVNTRIISDVRDYGIKGINEKEVYILSTNGDNFVNYPLLMKYVRNANGIKYINGIARIKLSDDGVKALVNSEILHGDYFIITAGAWNSIIARNANLRIPLLPYKCQAAAFLSRRIDIIVYDYVLEIYIRPLGSIINNALGALGLSVMVSGDGNSRVTEPGKEGSVDREFLNEIKNKVRARLGNALLIGSRFGFCESTPDMRPVVGVVGSNNLLLIGGFNGYGAEVGPALAMAVVNYLLDGSWPDYARPYLIDRFGNDWPNIWDIDIEAHELCV